MCQNVPALTLRSVFPGRRPCYLNGHSNLQKQQLNPVTSGSLGFQSKGCSGASRHRQVSEAGMGLGSRRQEHLELLPWAGAEAATNAEPSLAPSLVGFVKAGEGSSASCEKTFLWQCLRESRSALQATDQAVCAGKCRQVFKATPIIPNPLAGILQLG